MRPIERSEIVDYETYEEGREAFRRDVMAQKAVRRIRLGEYLTFLFENRDTVRYQIQEMIRIERIVREADIVHEIDTYNELLGGPGGLGCTLLIEIEREEERDVLLREWVDLPGHLYVRLEDGTRIPASYDERQVGGDRLSSVQYLRFDTGGEVPVAVGTDFGPLEGETELTPEQREALARDLEE
jgi:hypothetical protein